MPLIDTVSGLLARASRALGLETVDRFPPGHQYAQTRWDRAYFDIASDLKAEAIERAMCDAIANTPAVFAHIVHPTPRMQRTLLGVIDSRLRRACGAPADLLKLMIDAYDSKQTPEALPGLRAAIERTRGDDMPVRVHDLVDFLRASPGAFGVVDASDSEHQARRISRH